MTRVLIIYCVVSTSSKIQMYIIALETNYLCIVIGNTYSCWPANFSLFDLKQKKLCILKHENLILQDFSEVQWIALYLLFSVKYLLQTDVFF